VKGLLSSENRTVTLKALTEDGKQGQTEREGGGGSRKLSYRRLIPDKLLPGTQR